MDYFRIVAERLAAINQSQLLQYYDQLHADEQEALLSQIDTLDFSVLKLPDTESPRGHIEPIDAMTIQEIEQNCAQYREIGLQTLRAGKVGAVLLAGGQGSRLGFEHPKGMYNIGETRALYIFECLINRLSEVVQAAGVLVPLFVMTSAANNDETQAFFVEHHYFGYSSDHIWFFVQEELPTLDLHDKLMLVEKGRVSTAPNGNGGWYASMARTGMLNIVRSLELEWLNVFAVDNVLQRIADPCFIGAVIASGMASGSKVVAKADPEEKVGVMCLEDGRPSIVEYYEMTPEMIARREPNGALSYNYGVILNYLFRVDRLNDSLGVELPLHKAFKKVKCLNEQGVSVTPDVPNAYKFETLALDMVRLQESCLVYEVDRSVEFAPVKNPDGADSVDTARELLRQNGIEL